jgi:hypothetical protein
VIITRRQIYIGVYGVELAVVVSAYCRDLNCPGTAKPTRQHYVPEPDACALLEGGEPIVHDIDGLEAHGPGPAVRFSGDEAKPA